MSVEFCCYHDGQFWVGALIVHDGDSVRAARVVFGSEPSDAELFVYLQCHGYELLARADRSPALSAACSQPWSGNPKRAARQVARAARQPRPSTAAQEALRLAREAGVQQRTGETRADREREAAQRRLTRRTRAREKHRGH